MLVLKTQRSELLEDWTGMDSEIKKKDCISSEETFPSKTEECKGQPGERWFILETSHLVRWDEIKVLWPYWCYLCLEKERRAV